MAMDMATALNEEFKDLRSLGLEAIQIIDVLPAYTQDLWQIQAVNRMLEGLDDLISIWHICYGSVDAQTEAWVDKASDRMPMFEPANVTAIHFESAHRDFRKME